MLSDNVVPTESILHLRSSTSKSSTFQLNTSTKDGNGSAVFSVKMKFENDRFTVVVLLALCAMLMYFDRLNLSVAVVDIRKEYGWSEIEIGNALGGFFYGYVTSQVFASILASKFGGKIVLTGAVILWNLLTIATPVCVRWGPRYLVAVRMVLGASQGVFFPVSTQLLSEWVPESERSRSIASINAGVYAGAVLCFVTAPIIMAHFGWARVFHVFGIAGLLWVIPFVVFVQDPPTRRERESSSIGSNESVLETVKLLGRDANEPNFQSVTSGNQQSIIGPGAAATATLHTTWGDFSQILRCPVAYAIAIVHFCHNGGHYVMMSWLPTYFEKELGVSGSSLAFLCVPYLAMAVSVSVASVIADRRIEAGVPVERVRRIATIGGFMSGGIAMAVVGLAGNSHVIAVSGLCISLACNSAGPAAGYEAAKLDIASPRMAGKLQSISNSFATFAGIVGVPMVAVLREQTGDWSAVFYSISFLFLFAAAVFWKFGRWKGRVLI